MNESPGRFYPALVEVGISYALAFRDDMALAVRSTLEQGSWVFVLLFRHDDTFQYISYERV